jgi:hypothetical protein
MSHDDRERDNSQSTQQPAPNLVSGEAGDAATHGNGHDPNAGKSTAETQAAMLKAATQ